VRLSLDNCVVGEMKEVSRVFSMPDEGALYEELGVTPPHDYVDALGEPIDPTRFVEAAHVAQFRNAQARRVGSVVICYLTSFHALYISL
jgi:hypothetical protein